jgi:glutathione peroxidase
MQKEVSVLPCKIQADSYRCYFLVMYLLYKNSILLFLLAGLPLIDLYADTAAPAGTNAPSPVAATPAATNASPTNAAPVVPAGPSLFNFTVNTLDGKPADLGQYRGHVALVVNTASKSGYTSQYAGLEKLYEEYKDKGFVILGFPSNDFGGQEPDSAADIAKFCATKFNVTFPMFEKVKTKGDGQSPIYQFLTTGHGSPNWNFHKYLVDKSGNVIREFESQVNPDSKDLRSAIDAALK